MIELDRVDTTDPGATPYTRIQTGHTSMAPVMSQDGKRLYVCERFENAIVEIDLPSKREVRRTLVAREPVAADITKDGRYLLVANHLHSGRADVDQIAAVISVVDLAAGRVIREIALPSGSGLLNDLRVSPDGMFAAVTHVFASFNRATSQVQFGWLTANALTLIDVEKMAVHGTVLIDDFQGGAANPWGAAWSGDGRMLLVAHAGTHEVSVIDMAGLLRGLQEMEQERTVGNTPPRQTVAGTRKVGEKNRVLAYGPRYEGLEPGLPFLVGARRRVKLPEGDLGPRAVIVVGTTAYVANYFSDTLTAIDLASPGLETKSIPLWQKSELAAKERRREARLKAMSLEKRGEFYFNDATICLQGWQSCASCHPGQGRSDGLNWDLLNDGIGNPKNTKSLLLAFQTPPAMSLGVRETARSAVRAGISHILFTKQPEEVALAIDAYLKSLKPVPSPHLLKGQLSPAAQRGKSVFVRAGCADCHPPGLFTDLGQYDVGTRRAFDHAKDKFDTPTLVELWRTAPYLHDGSAATVRDVVTVRNPHDEHGKTSDLSPSELNDLCEYLLSL